jgi:putative nucleotidyltransferase with HDIG domain
MTGPALDTLHHRRRTWMTGLDQRNLAIEAWFGVALVASVIALFIFSPAGNWAPWWLVAGLLAAAALASAVRFEVGAGWSSPMQLVQVPLWFAVPAPWIPVFVAISLVAGQLIEYHRHGHDTPRWRALLAADDTWHAVGAATVLAIIGTPVPSVEAIGTFALVFAGQITVDSVYSVLHGRVTSRSSWKDLWASSFWVAAVDAALMPVAFVVCLAMVAEPLLSLALLPLIVLFSEFAREREERILQAMELSSAYRGTAELMNKVLQADDEYTGGEHTSGVVAMAMAVGRDLELGPRTMRALEFGALLHDIGKLQVPNEIINKPGKLTAAEWEIVKQHPVTGQEMLNQVGGALTEAGHIVRAHHERWDGTGYPDGLAARDIPLEARIITVCDSFSAMTTDRPYRAAMMHQDAVAELDRCVGSQFDPVIVDAMHRVLAEQGQILTVSRPRLVQGNALVA